MSTGNRIVTLLDAMTALLAKSGLFTDVRSRLDAYELDDLMSESFRAPGARVIFAGFKPEKLSGGGQSLDVRLVIAVIAAREGRPDPGRASADAAAVDLIMQVCQLVEDNPYLGLTKLTALSSGAATIGISEESNKKGVAIALVEMQTTLLQVVTPRPDIGAVFDTARPDPFPALTLNGEGQP